MKDQVFKPLFLVWAAAVGVAFPSEAVVVLNEANRTWQVRTHAETVAGLIKELGIHLSQMDRVTPPLETPIVKGMKVRIVRVNKKVQWRKKAFPIVYYKVTPHLKPGQKKVIKKGKPKLIQEKWVAYYKDGVKTLEKVVERKVLKEGVPQIVLVGRNTRLASRGLRRIKRVLTMVATAYHPTRCLGCNGKGLTATGHKAKYGVVAVDPKVIPLSSRLYIPGYGYATALDTGGKIKGYRIDLVFEELEKVRRFGRKKVTVFVLE